MSQRLLVLTRSSQPENGHLRKKRSSFIAMTNHMIIMVCKSDVLYIRFYLYHAQSLILYLIQSPFVIQPQAIVFYHNVLLSMPYHVEMLLPKRSSLHFFYPVLVYIYYIQIVVNSKPSQGLSLITTTNQTILDARCTYMIRSYTCHVISSV